MANHSTKRDANQAEIVAALFAAGCSVQDLHAVGGGCPDLLVGQNGETFLMEVKMWRNQRGDPNPLTPCQKSWHRDWRGHVRVVTTPEEALRAVGLRV
jgi:hypothetical protein